MKVYGLQFDILWEDKTGNRKQIEAWIHDVLPDRDSLVVLPEMCCIGFTRTVEGLAEDPQGETERFYADLAQRYEIFLMGGVTHKGANGKGRNVCSVFDPEGRLVTSYTKVHPFTFSGETDFYEKGDGPVTFDWLGVTVAPTICYDLRFPELYRATAGAHLYAVIANWPAAREHHWVSLLVARAIENQAYVIGVNRCGDDPKLSYSGRSLIVDPQGKIVADGGNGVGWIQHELDLEELKGWRARFPALSDRRL